MISFFFGQSLTAVPMILSFGTTASFCFFAAKAYYPKNYFINGLLLVTTVAIIIIGCAYIAGRFYDLSYDGQWYHQDIILTLANGWNPIYHHLKRSDISTANILNSYPKAAEILAASLYKFTGKIEFSKMFNIFLIVTAFCFTCSVLLKIKKLHAIFAFLLSILFVLNPVSICEIFSFYNDGQVYALMLSLLSVIMLIFYSKQSFVLFPLFFLLVLLVDIKLTSLVFSIISIFTLLCICWYNEKIHLFAKFFLVSISAILFGLLIIGFNPFVTNIVYYKQPFYPAVGNNSFNFVLDNAPENYLNKNSLEVLILSIFSESDFLKKSGKFAKLKIPFTYTNNELHVFTSTDPIEGGFGPLFSGAVLITLLTFFYILRYRKKTTTRILYLVSVLLLFSSLVVGAAFYARYIPQFWLIPCFTMLVLLLLKDKFCYLLFISLYSILVFNNILISQVNIENNIIESQKLYRQLTTIAALSKPEQLQVNFGDFELSNNVRFQEANINFVEEKKGLRCARKVRLLGALITESLIQTCENSMIKLQP